MKYFTFHELTHSNTAARLGIDNTPTAEEAANIHALVDNVLDPARKKYGSPIMVSSGYRCPALNKAVGGEATSQHLKGEAADLYTYAGVKGNQEIGVIIAKLGNFDQIIFENVGKDNLLPAWIHVSWKRKGTNRGEIKKHVTGTTTYPYLTLAERKSLGL